LTNLGRFTFDNGHSFTWTTGRNMARRANGHANIIRRQWALKSHRTSEFVAEKLSLNDWFSCDLS
jgi:hypothetical protein